MAAEAYRRTYYLAAGEGTPERTMPPGLLFARCIEVATDHANLLGVGFDTLIKSGQSWVLSRMVVEMTEWPRVDSNYTIETWVESLTRAFSERNFRIFDSEGRVAGYARSTWVVIDLERRTLADISRFDALRQAILADIACPIAPCGRHRPLGSDAVAAITRRFAYSDIDSNRHVNTVRYVEMLTDCFTPDFHAANPIARLEVSFMRECTYGEEATIYLAPDGHAELRVNGERRIHFKLATAGKNAEFRLADETNF